MNLFEWNDLMIQKLQANFGFEVFTPGLDRTYVLYRRFIEKYKKIPVITIAGTNGKGQTSYSLAKMLALNNKKVAVWSSPHILYLNERFQFFNNQEHDFVSNDKFETILNEIILLKEEKQKRISFYEALFYIFLKWIEELNLDFIIFEVGLGGRLDAVNHFNSNINIVTSISRDHVEILGNSYSRILFEKLGIVKSNSKLYTSFHLNFLTNLTKEYILNKNVSYLNLDPDLDDYFKSNQNLVKQLMLDLKLIYYEHELNKLNLKGRYETYSDEFGRVMFNGAHNIDGIRSFLKKECLKFERNNYLVSFSKRTEKELRTIIKIIAFYLPKNSVSICFFEHPKAEKRDIIIKILDDLNLREYFQVEANWKQYFSKSRPYGQITVFGSFYFIGEVQRYLIINFNTHCHK